MPPKKLSLNDLLAHAVADRHSPLYIAMRDNYEAMNEAFLKKRLDWRALITGFNDLGLRNGKNEAPTIRNAQNTWARVRADMLASRGKATSKTTTPTEAPLPPVPPVESEPAEFPQQYDDGPSRPTFRTGGLKSWLNPTTKQE